MTIKRKRGFHGTKEKIKEDKKKKLIEESLKFMEYQENMKKKKKAKTMAQQKEKTITDSQIQNETICKENVDKNKEIKNNVGVKKTADKESTTQKIRHTVSVAIPASVIGTVQSKEIRTYMIGQIAHALTIFKVDEIVIFEDNLIDRSLQPIAKKFFARILQYMETPQYLRQQLFSRSSDFQFISLVNPLNAPHHLEQFENSRFREGIVIESEEKTETEGSFVDIGLKKKALVNYKIPPKTRVTVDLLTSNPISNKGIFIGHAVSPSAPYETEGIYWGYTTRIANSFSEIFSDCPYEEGYDVTIGTSKKGNNFDSNEFSIGEFRHLMVVFGGSSDLEEVTEKGKKIENISSQFNFWLNTCPHQGSSSIRTEEALLITLARLQPFIQKCS